MFSKKYFCKNNLRAPVKYTILCLLAKGYIRIELVIYQDGPQPYLAHDHEANLESYIGGMKPVRIHYSFSDLPMDK